MRIISINKYIFCLFIFPLFILITLEMKEYTKISIDFTFEQLFFLHSFAQGTVFHADANCPLINLFVSLQRILNEECCNSPRLHHCFATPKTLLARAREQSPSLFIFHHMALMMLSLINHNTIS